MTGEGEEEGKKDSSFPYSPAFDFIVTSTQELEDNPPRQIIPGSSQSANIQQRKKEYEEWCRQAREKETTIERYCRLIRGECATFELTFEEDQKIEAENEKLRNELHKLIKTRKQNNKFMKNRPGGMTKTAWLKQQRRIRKEERERMKQEQLDDHYKFRMSPISIFEDQLLKISCRCEAEAMRQGQFCDTCRLIAITHKYMLGLFRDIAEGAN